MVSFLGSILSSICSLYIHLNHFSVSFWNITCSILQMNLVAKYHSHFFHRTMKAFILTTSAKYSHFSYSYWFGKQKKKVSQNIKTALLPCIIGSYSTVSPPVRLSIRVYHKNVAPEVKTTCWAVSASPSWTTGAGIGSRAGTSISTSSIADSYINIG